ncbi:hypothetical protein [Actinomadura algeriensis]|uniref:SUKH-4 immunity protein of toxin-antitoxin system n=1 Tax=Actinomadura algeriensis TaxID=1679523 RepID=A0ABR9JJ10_9ACTN|nr:hypothetical protein [Actinomadura algeriensis]MBE1530543.1 hypothetical protein [Actinomadura algeriensis]
METLRAKLDLVRRVEAEHGFGVEIGGPRALEPIPEVPGEVTEVFGLFSRLAGDYFDFVRPEEIAGPDAWRWRRTNENCPLGDPLEIGHERYGLPRDLRDDIPGGAPIRLDLRDGSVYYVDPDDYIAFYKNPDVDEVESADFAPGIVKFFDSFVLGPRYPELVEAVIGPNAVDERDREGRPRDSWTRLLRASGLL